MGPSSLDAFVHLLQVFIKEQELLGCGSLYADSSGNSYSAFSSSPPSPHGSLEGHPSKAVVFQSGLHGRLTPAKRPALFVERQLMAAPQVQYVPGRGGSWRVFPE